MRSRNNAMTRTPSATAAKMIITSLSSSAKGNECVSACAWRKEGIKNGRTNEKLTLSGIKFITRAK